MFIDVHVDVVASGSQVKVGCDNAAVQTHAVAGVIRLVVELDEVDADGRSGFLGVVKVDIVATGTAVQVAAAISELTVAVTAYPVIGAAHVRETDGTWGRCADPEVEVGDWGAAAARAGVHLVHQVDVVTAGAVVQVSNLAYPASSFVVVVLVIGVTAIVIADNNHVGDIRFLCPGSLCYRAQQN